MLIFLVIGLAYGIAAGTIKNATDAINAIVKTFAGLSGMIFLLLIISQFIAYFNYSNLATIAAVNLANLLQGANLDTLVLLRGLRRRRRHPRPDHHRCRAEMGDLRADLRALDDEARRRPGGGARRLPRSAIRRSTRSPRSTSISAWWSASARNTTRMPGVGTVVAMMLPYVGALFVVWIADSGRLVPAGAAVRALGRDREQGLEAGGAKRHAPPATRQNATSKRPTAAQPLAPVSVRYCRYRCRTGSRRRPARGPAPGRSRPRTRDCRACRHAVIGFLEVAVGIEDLAVGDRGVQRAEAVADAGGEEIVAPGRRHDRCRYCRRA